MERNVMVCFENGENVCVRADERLTNDNLRLLGEKCVGKVNDIYDVRDDELQYYIIDGRCNYTSDLSVERVLKRIGH